MTEVKVLAVGDCACGKTALLRTFCTNKFPTSYEPTLSSEQLTKQVQLDGRAIEFVLFDTPAQEDSGSHWTSSYPESADVVLICFRVDSPASLANAVDKWLPDVRSCLPKVPMILVANKNDRRTDPAVLIRLSARGTSPVSPDRGREVARQIQAAGYVECSALTGESVEEVFQMVANVVNGRCSSKARVSTRRSKVPDDDLCLQDENGQKRHQDVDSADAGPKNDVPGDKLESLPVLYPRTGVIKLVVVGDNNCEKTRLLVRYTTDDYPEYCPTVFNNYTMTVKVNGSLFELELWDTTGQEDYYRLRPLSYPNTDVVLLCFNVASPASFENIKAKWLPEIRHHIPQVPIVLVATMKERRADPDVVSRLANSRTAPVSSEMGRKLAKDIGAADYVECSALTGEGVQEAFDTAIVAAIHPHGDRDSKSVIRRIKKYIATSSVWRRKTLSEQS